LRLWGQLRDPHQPPPSPPAWRIGPYDGVKLAVFMALYLFAWWALVRVPNARHIERLVATTTGETDAAPKWAGLCAFVLAFVVPPVAIAFWPWAKHQVTRTDIHKFVCHRCGKIHPLKKRITAYMSSDQRHQGTHLCKRCWMELADTPTDDVRKHRFDGLNTNHGLTRMNTDAERSG
jgi:hypothetical protein